MKKQIIAVCTIILSIGALTQSATAQSDTSKHHGWWSKKEFAGALQLQTTYRQSNLGQLNTILNKNNIPSLPDNNFSLNLSMSHLHGKWVFEDGIGGTFTSTSAANTSNGIKASYNNFQVYTRAGYDISTNTNVRFFPFLGLNFSDAMLRIRDDNKTQSTSDFSTELLNNTASKTLWNPQFGIELGAGFDYVIKMKTIQKEHYTFQRNIPIGLRIGYYLQATNSDWKIDDNYTLNNGPNQKQSNVFVTFNIGLGYVVKKQ